LVQHALILSVRVMHLASPPGIETQLAGCTALAMRFACAFETELDMSGLWSLSPEKFDLKA